MRGPSIWSWSTTSARAPSAWPSWPARARRGGCRASAGDLSENAEYHIAKEDQAHLETKIARLNARLRAARVVEAPTNSDVVVFGATVTVADDESGREATWTLVAPATRSTSRPRAASAVSASSASDSRPTGTGLRRAGARAQPRRARRPA